MHGCQLIIMGKGKPADREEYYDGKEKWLFKIDKTWECRNASYVLCYSFTISKNVPPILNEVLS